jgi:N-methylhydantoinase A/oxoprolinase/acetone carboxylase beta subunit
MPVRIGIDVGGTFTDAVVLDNDTFQLIGTVKIPTTHNAKEGVAAGIVEALGKVLTQYNLCASDVVFIAHGTTQATNALLEGDVEQVGIIGMGRGLEGFKVKSDTAIGNIELAPGKFLKTKHYYLNPDNMDTTLREYTADMTRQNINVAVVAAAYSVDDPRQELKAMEIISQEGILGTCSHEISKLYGLKIRTRTAVINASILPKMIQTANLTEKSVIRSDIKAPLMIMRCDGGVMSVREIKKRPVLTMLSGPAAGVAGALMYEKISEGIFLEVGGTSTDISAIHNGQVMIGYADVGGHKTYVNSLDVRTVGIAGGSMIRLSANGIADVGPRSAHIAGLPYIGYVKPGELGDLEIRRIKPLPDDFDDYCAVYDATYNKTYALTLSDAANASGYVERQDYAFGYKESVEKAFAALSSHTGLAAGKLLSAIHAKAAEKNKKVVLALIEDYELRAEQLVLVGGGGGAAAVVPYLAKELKMPFRIAKNAEVISPIGVALAMVRDIVERTVNNPTEEDIMRIRKEAEQQALKSGAASGTIEVFIEVDSKKNLVRATATGTTELRAKNRVAARLTPEELIAIGAASMHVSVGEVQLEVKTDDFAVVQGKLTHTQFFGFSKKIKYPVRILNSEGVVRIQCADGVVIKSRVKDCAQDIGHFISRLTAYSEGGERIPQVYMLIGARLIDFSKLMNKDQVLSLQAMETAGLDEENPLTIVMSNPANK